MSHLLQFASIMLAISLLSNLTPVSALNCGAGQCTLPSFPMCAQIPAQDALLYGNCSTTDFGCVCADPDKVSTFLKLLRISCSPPTGSEKAYQTSLQKLIDLCAKKGHDVTGLVQGFASTAAVSSESPPTATFALSTDPTKSSSTTKATSSVSLTTGAGVSPSAMTATATTTATLAAVVSSADRMKQSVVEFGCAWLGAAVLVAVIAGY